jgi:hypothetical protein
MRQASLREIADQDLPLDDCQPCRRVDLQNLRQPAHVDGVAIGLVAVVADAVAGSVLLNRDF